MKQDAKSKGADVKLSDATDILVLLVFSCASIVLLVTKLFSEIFANGKKKKLVRKSAVKNE